MREAVAQIIRPAMLREEFAQITLPGDLREAFAQRTLPESLREEFAQRIRRLICAGKSRRERAPVKRVSRRVRPILNHFSLDTATELSTTHRWLPAAAMQCPHKYRRATHRLRTRLIARFRTS